MAGASCGHQPAACSARPLCALPLLASLPRLPRLTLTQPASLGRIDKYIFWTTLAGFNLGEAGLR